MNNTYAKLRKIIKRQNIEYQTATNRTINDVGQYETTYTTPISMKAIVQPVNQTLMQTLGLDFQKVYITVHLPLEPKAIHAGESGDIITYNSNNYKIIHIEDWYATAGYTLVRAVQL